MGTVTPAIDLRYPLGQFEAKAVYSDSERAAGVLEIAEAPARLRAAVASLSDSQLDTPYREGGWTVRQVVHHVADSHVNLYVRIRFALTESEPTIKPYDEKLWAELPDARSEPVGVSLALLDSLHHRLVVMLRALTPDDCARTFRHAELGIRTIDQTIALYAWHGRHHTAHITSLRARMNW